MKPYVIYGDKTPLRTSGGRTVLHKLCEDLKIIGHRAIIETDPIEAEAIVGDDYIAVYPDRVNGNPLNANHIVRYMLHKKDYFDKTPREYGKNELVIKHSTMLPYKAHVLHTPITPQEWGVTTLQKKRTKSVYYKGKYDLHPYTHSAIPATTITHFEKITRNNPTDRDELENLLLQTEYFYCLDTFTILKLEAVLCGAITILFENPDFPKEAYEDSEYGLNGCIWIGKGESIAEQMVKQLRVAQLTLPVARVMLERAYNEYAEQLVKFTEISQEYAS